MLNSIFSSPRRSRLRAAAAPPNMRIYAIGDIHGRVDLLRAVHRQILDDAQHSRARRKLTIYLGDYIDRGLDSREVIDVLLDDPLPGFETVHLKGNHEKALLDFLTDASVAMEWFYYGGDATLSSYHVARPAPGGGPQALLQVQAELLAKLPPRHLAFYRSLALYHREGDYLFVHAGLKPGVPIEKQSEDDLLWIRDEFLRSNADHGCIVVHGHTISPRPEVKGNRIGIDTGAYATGRLTCLRIEEDEREFLGV